MAAGWVTVCPECGREVGVVRGVELRGEPVTLKRAVHAAVGPDGSGARRPRCRFGSGGVVDPALVWPVEQSAATRKLAEVRAGRAARRERENAS